MLMSGVMPLYDQKRKENSMTLHFTQKAQQAKNRWLSPLLPSILTAVSLIATLDPASLAAAAECQVTEDGGTIQGMPTWKGTTLSILPLTITVERDIYGGLVPSPVLEVAPYMESSRIVRGNTENQGIATIGVCLSQDIRKSARFNQALIKSNGKTQAKAHTQVMKVSALPYNGKRQVLTIRTTPPEIGTPARYKTATIIGPVQEIQKPILSDERSVSQAVATLPSTVESPSLFGGQPFVALNPFQSALQLPDNESLRMNLTAAQALHGGNCVSGCP
jgi:hypothetical protein